MSDSEPPLTISYDPSQQRFIGPQGSQLSYELGPNSEMIINHVGVPTALRGRGIAAQLVDAALLDARENGRSVVPVCSYASSYMKRKGLLDQ